MKIAFVILSFVAFASADWAIKTHEDLIQYRNECVAKLSVPAEYVEKFKKWDFPDDDTTKCYIECVFGKLGLFDAQNGGFDVEHLVKQLGQNRNADEVRVDINKCIDKNEQNTDNCSWVYRGFKCFVASHLPLVQQSIKN